MCGEQHLTLFGILRRRIFQTDNFEDYYVLMALTPKLSAENEIVLEKESCSSTVLPDGLFSNPKSQFG
jgi:hypothetical protein